jgi:hypothetical protein
MIEIYLVYWDMHRSPKALIDYIRMLQCHE